MSSAVRHHLISRSGAAVALALGVFTAAGVYAAVRGQDGLGARKATTPSGEVVRCSAADLVFIAHDPPTGTVAPRTMHDALHAAATSWNSALAGCGAPTLRVVRQSSKSARVGPDGISTVLLRGARWCNDDSEQLLPRCESFDGSSRAAMTRLYPSASGHSRFADVREADI